MVANSERLNFRCTGKLREAMEDEQRRTGIRLSEQARIALERAYLIDWQPPALRQQTAQPTPSAPGRKRKS